jgi:protein MpaA
MAPWRPAAALIAVVSVAGLVVALTDADSRSPRRLASPPRLSVARVRRRPLAPATSARRTMTIGYSVDRRPIRAVVVGDPHAGRAVLVVGCVHGNEPAGITIARRLAAQARLRGAALWIIPILNPDGVAAGTRQNGDGVDLNRNFPYRWRPLGTLGYLQYAGPRALSEPESRAVHRLILQVRPQISIWFHQPQGLVDLSGGNPAVERRFARLAGLPALRLTRYPGSAVGWENRRLPGTTAFVVELPPGSLSPAHSARYAAAVLRLAR